MMLMKCFRFVIVVSLICRIRSFSPLATCRSGIRAAYHRTAFIFAAGRGFEQAYELGSSLLERFDTGQVSKDVALPGVPLSPLPVEIAQILQNLKRNQDFVSSAQVQTSSNETKPFPAYLSNHSTCSSCRWVKVLPQLQGLFREAFHAVIESFRYYNLSNSSTTIQLSPYDLFHGHLFRRSFYYHQNYTTLRADSNICTTDVQALDNEHQSATEQNSTFEHLHHQLGILFHCFEYPAIDNPHGILANFSLGYHQVGSNCCPSLEEWKFRNVLWLLGWGDDCMIESGKLEPKIWLLNGSAPEISQLQVDGSCIELCGPDSPNTVWEGFLVDSTSDGPKDGIFPRDEWNTSVRCFQSSSLIADIYYGMEGNGGSIWCEICKKT